jgi:hypothetical protein
MRRAGPDRSDVKNTSKGLSSLKMVSSWIWTAGGAATCVSPVAWAVKLHCLQMGSWYWIGVCAGLGVAVGVLLGAVFAGTRIALTAALVLAAGIGVAIGFALGQWDEALGGGVGGVLGAIGSAQLASGTMRRGGARFGVAVFFGLAALALAAIAWIPVAGYFEAALVPAFAARLRGRAPERYAGLRSLARD